MKFKMCVKNIKKTCNPLVTFSKYVTIIKILSGIVAKLCPKFLFLYSQEFETNT